MLTVPVTSTSSSRHENPPDWSRKTHPDSHTTPAVNASDSNPVRQLLGGLVGLVLFVLLVDAVFCGCLVFEGTILETLYVHTG